MSYFPFPLAAFILGFLAAIPTGPVQIEVVRRSVNGYLKPSFMVILGAFLVDALYGIIAFFSIAPFLEEKRVMVVFWLIGGIILIVLGTLTIRHSMSRVTVDYSAGHLTKKRWALLGGVSLSATNPMMILWWLTASRIIRDIGMINNFTHSTALIFLAAGSLGLAAYLTILSLFVNWAKRFIDEDKMRKVNMVFGIFLILIAVYFISASARYFLNG